MELEFVFFNLYDKDSGNTLGTPVDWSSSFTTLAQVSHVPMDNLTLAPLSLALST
jgi:hypothetical protein